MAKEPPRKGNGGSRVPRSAKVRALDNRSFNRMVNRAASQTDWNDHTGARRTIAKYFKYDDLVKRYDEVAKLHEEAGRLTSDLRDVREAIDATMESRIRRDYGDDVLRKVNRGL